MKLLIKAYGKKNIAELTPKKVLVTPKNKKPYWMTTYIRTGKIENPSANHDFVKAVKSGDLEGIKTALDNGANVNMKDDYGDTALIRASDRGKIDMARLLLDYGADVNVRGYRGDTPLMLVSREGYYSMVKLFLDHGADVNIRNDKGETALDLAIRSGYTDVANLLQSYGAKKASEIEKPSTIPEGKVVMVKNEELPEPFCYEGLDENGDWYGVGDYDPDKIIPGEVVITSEGWIYWKGDYARGDSNPLNDRPLTEDEMKDVLEMIGHPGYPSARLVDLDDEDEW